jgi:ribosome recycling factor
VKLVKSKAEEHKVSLRNSRRKAKEALDKMVKDGDIGEDEGSRAEKELDALTRKYTDTIEEMAKRKEAELLAV